MGILQNSHQLRSIIIRLLLLKMRRRTHAFALMAVFLVGCAISVDSATSTSSVIKKEVTVKNSTVTAAASELVTTTRRPLIDGARLPCACLKGQCGCCTGVILERFRQKFCLNITYEPDEFGFTAALSLNDRVLYKNTISDVEANWESFTLLDFSFNCVRLGVNGVAVVGPEEGGGLPLLPFDEEDQTDEDYDDSARNVPSPLLLDQKVIAASLEPTNTDADKSNYLKYTGGKNTSGRTNSTAGMKPDSNVTIGDVSIGVKKLPGGDFLITLKGNTTLRSNQLI